MILEKFDNTKHKYKQSQKFYKENYSEYLVEKYPANFFDFGLDVGASTDLFPWHFNRMAMNNQNTKFYGFEPDTKHYNEINNLVKNKPNAKLYKEFFGRHISLKKFIERENIDINKKWFFDIDCEGDEKYLFKSQSELDILKKATHIGIETHPKLTNELSRNDFTKIIFDNFNDSHKIIRTYYCPKGGALKLDNTSYILIKNDIYENTNNNIKKYVEHFALSTKNGTFWGPYHKLDILN